MLYLTAVDFKKPKRNAVALLKERQKLRDCELLLRTYPSVDRVAQAGYLCQSEQALISSFKEC